MRTMLLIINVLIIIIILMFISKFHILLYVLIPFSITLVLLVLVSVINYNKQQTKYKTLYEEHIIKPLLTEINPNFNISNDKMITQELYDEAEFEQYSNPIILNGLNKYIIFESKVGIYGIINNRNIQISNIKIGEEINDYFIDCIFCYIKLNYNYYENPIRLRHVKDKRQNMVYKKEKINLENNTLNNKFTIDTVKANKLFDSINNQKIIELYRKNINNPFEVTIKENKLFIRISVINPIQSNPQKNPYNPNSIKRLYDFLQYIFDLSTLFIEITDKK